MYRYDEFDAAYVRERVAQFRDQTQRRIDGRLTEDEYKPLRLQNGLYLQLHAYMLRVAIPYGTLSSRQMRALAEIAERWDRGYGHFTTRQNIQFNWTRLSDVGDILDHLAAVEMHAIQTSGNCIRNVTADHFAGAAADEIEDPRPTAELIRQWSTAHPEFAFLPRKFKVAVTGSPNDRAVTRSHDIGLRMLRDANGAPGYEVIVGGGMGRTPMVGKVMRGFLPRAELLPYLEAILRVYNLHGRRDNKYKARIKILVHETGEAEIREQVEAEFRSILANGGAAHLPGEAELARIAAYFAPPALPERSAVSDREEDARTFDPVFAAWAEVNTTPHGVAGYAIATVSLKAIGASPGDATASQMRALADMADRYSQGELRISHEQNVILPHVARDDLPALHAALLREELAEANSGLISDIIACPGLDYCALATARSIPIAQDISRRFSDGPRARAIGEFRIKISGCINACGHHHMGHVGILGLEKAGVESYQITLGGDHTENAAIGERVGPGLGAEEVGPAIERLVDAYLDLRASPEERFVDVCRRLGLAPFKAAIYREDKRDAA
ncbi:nitrite/sulfite reductase [Rubrimonas cliftonensis]|uniref:Sulfite reductase (NADPH) hemoprotein beta-component n=1 Tax=Rubrimonas cliftonensis TaxID=89524 RepID=A0A1H4BYE5_9RHOB|nr:nitrite/sulfite reductase [Rubrimonas cliftonensis]SEA53104.1 sulfite reductase (NADPH) hemoprotein beta-component [Rubrimonas cliftonensis]